MGESTAQASRNETTGRRRQGVIGVLCLAAGLSYRAKASFPLGLLETLFLAGLSAFFVTTTVLVRRNTILRGYWEIPFAFFVFSIAGFLDVTITREFVVNILHETPTATNPLASTVLGSVLAQLVSALVIVTPAILLTKISGTRLASIYLDRHRIWRGLRIALIGFTVFYFLTFFGLLQTLFPNSAVTPLRFLALSPAILILVLSNGLREEVWFRGLFLKKYGKFLSPLASNMVQASVFASFHFQVQYTPYLLGFLGITFILGLWLGHMMQATGNILAPAVFHAGADIPIYVAFLSYAQ